MNHDQVDQLVRRANPAPEPFSFDVFVGHVLDLERSMDMQTDDRPMAETRTENRWRGPLIGIAAAAVLLVGGWIVINTGDDVVTPAPDATELPDAPLDPGAYFVDTDGDADTSTRGTFVIEGDGWEGISGGTIKDPESDDVYTSLLVVEVEEVYETACAMSGRGPVAAESTAAGLANQFANNGMIVREALAPVTAFGYDGHKLVMEVPAGCADQLDNVWHGSTFDTRYYQGEGQVVEYYFLDVEGTVVMVETSWFPASNEEDVAELHAILDSLVITP